MKQSRSLHSLITVISLLLGVVWLSPAFAAAPSFTSLGQIKVDSLRVPGAMDLDGSGHLYVADTRGGLVHKFSPYGQLLEDFALQASGSGLAVTPDGQRLYVSRSQSVVVVDANTGEELGALVGAVVDAPEFYVAGTIDLDAAGNVYVVDAGSMQVKVYDASGQYQTQFGGFGLNAGQFNKIGGMAINPAGQVVVADASAVNAKVHAFSLDAGLNVVSVTAFANTTFGTPVMNSPRGLTFDANGRGFFLEYMNSQVRVADANFAYLGAYANPGYEVGQLSYVIDTVYDDANNRLFVGCDNGRIEIFGLDGTGTNPEQNNHAPSAPVPLSPIAGSEVASATPTLVFNNATDEDGDSLTYHVIVSRSGESVFATDVVTQTSSTSSALVDVVLEENAAYSWTVQATDGEDVSEVSATATFVVNAVEEAPSVPVLVTPVNGESINGTGVLSWEPSVDVDPNDVDVSYRFEVALDEAFEEVVAIESLTETMQLLGSLASYRELEIDTEYFWRVIALDAGQAASSPSNTGQFVYETTALTITANVPNAVVSFHGNHAYAGQVIGEAPLELRDMATATFSVVVEHAGFEPFVAQVHLEASDNANLYAELVPAMVVEKLDVKRKGINGRSGLSVSGHAVPFLVDFNNDGDLDLLVGDDEGQVTLFANMLVDRNRLSFDKGVSLGLPVLPNAVPFVADWDNDGRKDLIVGLVDGSVKLFINNGLEEAPEFGDGVDLVLSVGGNAAPAVVDYDGDGAKDLLVGNASGQVMIYLNQGSDAVPALAAPVPVMQVNGAVVPFPVDWDADGQMELLLSVNGDITVYAKVEGDYQAVWTFDNRREEFTGAFAINMNGSGKHLLAGMANGELVYLSGKSEKPVSAFYLALQDKVDELGVLIADIAPQFLDDVTAIRSMIIAGDMGAAKIACEALASGLVEGAPQVAALELAALCAKVVAP